MKKYFSSIAFISINGTVLLLVVFSVIICILGFQGFSEALYQQYQDDAFHIADAAATEVDPDRMDAYAESGGETEEYKAVWGQLDKLCNAYGVTFIYVIQPDLTDYGHIKFLFSTINHDSPYSVYEFGYLRETTNDDYKTKYKRLYDGESDRELVIRDKGYIETDPHITAMVPLRDSAGKTQAILCVQRQMDVLAQGRIDYIRKVALVILLAMALSILLLGVFMKRSLLNPLKKITDEAVRFAKENVPADEKLTETIRSKDEIGQLAGSIDQMEQQISDYMEDLTQVTAEKERIGTELSLASRIQMDMLPNVFPAFPEHEEFDIYADMDPAREVGGDFYDFFMIDEDHLYLAMADVSGKGIPASLFMMASKILLAGTTMIGRSPAQILEYANEAICSNNREEMFVTVWLGILELSTGKLVAANAGHEYPTLKRTGGEFEIIKDKHGFVIGGMPGMKYHDYELQLEPGDKLFLYTDGVPEATDDKNRLFGMERMMKALNRHPDATPKELLKHMRNAVAVFCRKTEQFDDLTMMCVEYKGKKRD